MNHYCIVAACVVGLLTTACSGPQNSPNQTGGMLVGGLAGGLLGSQFGGGTGALVGTGLGSLIGAYAGSEVGRSIDQRAAPPPPQYRDGPRYYREEPGYYREDMQYRNAPRYERSYYYDDRYAPDPYPYRY